MRYVGAVMLAVLLAASLVWAQEQKALTITLELSGRQVTMLKQALFPPEPVMPDPETGQPLNEPRLVTDAMVEKWVLDQCRSRVMGEIRQAVEAEVRSFDLSDLTPDELVKLKAAAAAIKAERK